MCVASAYQRRRFAQARGSPPPVPATPSSTAAATAAATASATAARTRSVGGPRRRRRRAATPRRAEMADVWHYLDHAATTPLRPEALEAMLPLLTRRLRQPVRRRTRWPARPGPRSTTPASGWPTSSGASPARWCSPAAAPRPTTWPSAGRSARGRGTVVCSAIEHHAVLAPGRAAGGRPVVAVDRRGVVDLDALAGARSTTTVALVSVMLVNNEIGTVQPLAAVAEVVRPSRPGAVLHTDAVQALPLARRRGRRRGRRPGHAQRAQVRRARRASARWWCATASRSQPLLLGGGQERERRSGTQDVAGVVGVRRRRRGRRRTSASRAGRARRPLRDRLWSTASSAAVPGARRERRPAGSRPAHWWPASPRVPRGGRERGAALPARARAGVLAAAASAARAAPRSRRTCWRPSGVDRALARGSLRLSLGWSTTDADVDAAVAGVVAAARRLQAHAA